MEEKHTWFGLVDKLLCYCSMQVHGVNQQGAKLANWLHGKDSIRGLQNPILTMVERETLTFDQQINPSGAFGSRGEVRARKNELLLADLNAIVSAHRNWSAVVATAGDFGLEFVDAAVYDKIEYVARLSLQTMPLFSGFSNSERVKDNNPNSFKVASIRRCQNSTRSVLNAGGTIISARYDDIAHSDDPHDPKSIMRITNLGQTLLLSDFELSKVELRVGEHGETDKIANKVRKLLGKLKKKYKTVDLVPLAARLCEMGHPVQKSVRDAVTLDNDDAAGVVEKWVVGALVERIKLESMEQKLSNARVVKMDEWVDDEKIQAVKSIQEVLTANTRLATCNGGRYKINNYYMMRKVVTKSANNTGRGGDTGGQVGKFNIEGWAKMWRDWSKKNQKEATGQMAEHHWQLAEHIVEKNLKNKYKGMLKKQGFWWEQ